MVLLYVLLLLTTATRTTAIPTVATVRLVSPIPIYHILPTYASFNIDSSCNRGFHHINFTNPNLHAAAKALSPSLLRFGGSGNDNLMYSLATNSHSCDDIQPVDPIQNECTYSTPGCLNRTHWNNLYQFATETNNQMLFGISFGLKQACQEKSAYVWNNTNAKELLQYLAANNQEMYGFQLGNELNNNGRVLNSQEKSIEHAEEDSEQDHNRSPFFNRNPSFRSQMLATNTQMTASGSITRDLTKTAKCNLIPKQQIDALETFSGMVQTILPMHWMPKLIGPDIGHLNAEEYLTDYLQLLDSTSIQLSAVTAHVYAGITPGGFNTPKELDDSKKEMGWYTDLIQRYAPRSQIWAGEEGPVAGGKLGTCGKNHGRVNPSVICGTYASALWSADDLGNRARAGFSQYQRQDLFGASYGLTGTIVQNGFSSLNVDDAIVLRPDWWVFYMFKRTIGTAVLQVESSDEQVRAYAFSGTPPSPHAAKTCTSSSGSGTMGSSGMTVLLINLKDYSESTVRLPFVSNLESSFYSAWILTPDQDSPFLKTALMNNKVLPAVIQHGERGGNNAFLKEMPVEPIVGHVKNDLILPPLAIAFVCIHDGDGGGRLGRSGRLGGSGRSDISVDAGVGSGTNDRRDVLSKPSREENHLMEVLTKSMQYLKRMLFL